MHLRVFCGEIATNVRFFFKCFFFFFLYPHRYKASNTDPEFSLKFLGVLKPNRPVNSAGSDPFKEDRLRILQERLPALGCYPAEQREAHVRDADTPEEKPSDD